MQKNKLDKNEWIFLTGSHFMSFLMTVELQSVLVKRGGIGKS